MVGLPKMRASEQFEHIRKQRLEAVQFNLAAILNGCETEGETYPSW